MGEVIRAARIEKGLSQTELARELEVTQVTISYWENGLTIPPTKKLPKLAEVLGIPIESLFDRDVV